MLWNQLNRLNLPETLRGILERNLADPPVAVMPGGPLEIASIDHLAFALRERTELHRLFGELIEDRHVEIIDTPRVWPFGDGCPEVPLADQKLMATVDVGGVQVTLLAPNSAGDIIANYVERAGGDELHHVAITVPDIVSAMQSMDAIPGGKAITPLAVDEDSLKQVFYRCDPDWRIVEIVERVNNFRGAFTCKNVVTLTAGERQNVFGSEMEVGAT